jgi:hypothetical protein
MALAYIRFFFVYAHSYQNGEGCQGVGCPAVRLSGGVQLQATTPTSCWPDNPAGDNVFQLWRFTRDAARPMDLRAWRAARERTRRQ